MITRAIHRGETDLLPTTVSLCRVEGCETEGTGKGRRREKKRTKKMCVGGKIRSHRGTASCRSSFFFFFLRCVHPLSVWLIRGCASEILKNNTHNTSSTHKPFIFFPILSLTFLNRSKNSHFLPPQLKEEEKKQQKSPSHQQHFRFQ